MHWNFRFSFPARLLLFIPFDPPALSYCMYNTHHVFSFLCIGSSCLVQPHGGGTLFPASLYKEGGVKYVTEADSEREQVLREVCHTANQKEVWRILSSLQSLPSC